MDIRKIKYFFIENKVLILIFLIALIIRIFFVSAYPIKWWDETIYANLGYQLADNPFNYCFNNGWGDYVPYGDETKAGFRAPLLPYTLAFFYILKLDFLVDFIVPFFGAFSVIIIFILAKKMFNYSTGIYSAAILAFIPIHVYYSALILTDVFSTFFILLCFLFFWTGFEENRDSHKLLFGIFLGLALLARYTSLWLLPVFFIYVIIRDRSLKIFYDKYLFISIFAFFIVLTPWLVYGQAYYSNPLGAFIHGSNASNYWGGEQEWDFYFHNLWKTISLISIIFVFSLLYLYFSKSYRKKQVYLLLIWVLFFLFMLIIMPHKEERYIIPIIPAVAIFSGFFLERFKYGKITLIICIIVLALVIFAYYNSIHSKYHNINSICFFEVMGALNQQQGDFITVSENTPIVHYYTKQESSYFPIINKESFESFAFSKNKTIYFVFTRSGSGFSDEELNSLKLILSENYNLVFNCSLDPEKNFIYTLK
ncbi:MAG: ArnT family glycosyltransferase [Candidatus Nanoarchaeia archaeon]